MILHKLYGVMNKMKKQPEIEQFKKEMAELKPGEGVTFDDGTKYEYGADLNAPGVPLIDPGEGRANVIRQFMFKMNPEFKKNFQGNKQDLFNAHVRQIAMTLWGDGLRPLDSVSPRVILNIKKGFYRIFVPCEAAKGVIFSHLDKPKNLSEALKSNSTTMSK